MNKMFLLSATALVGALFTSSAALAASQDFTIVNHSGHVLVTLNVSSSSESNWGPDILGQDVLMNGEEAEVTFDRNEAQCLWDIRVTYDDGDTNDERGVNLCETTTITITP